MAITCPRCGSQYDATLFEFGHRVRCPCGAEIEYPGGDRRAGHVAGHGENGGSTPRRDVYHGDAESTEEGRKMRDEG